VVKHDAFNGQITCNGGEIRQVLTNLFVNAMDAAGSGGNIFVHITHAKARDGSAATGVRVNIYDNGPGISLDVRQRLFTPFVSMKGEQGTGLGLWISKGIVEKNGGSIRFRTSTGERHGTCFSVFVPDQAENASEKNALARAANSFSTQQS
jgi:signal transduction histidine kinase